MGCQRGAAAGAASSGVASPRRLRLDARGVARHSGITDNSRYDLAEWHGHSHCLRVGSRGGLCGEKLVEHPCDRPRLGCLCAPHLPAHRHRGPTRQRVYVPVGKPVAPTSLRHSRTRWKCDGSWLGVWRRVRANSVARSSPSRQRFAGGAALSYSGQPSGCPCFSSRFFVRRPLADARPNISASTSSGSCCSTRPNGGRTERLAR